MSASLREAIRSCVATKRDFDLQLGAESSWLRIVGGACADADGVVRRLVGVVLAGERHAPPIGASDEPAALLISILDATQDGMVVIDAEGVMRFYSRAAERMFGYTPAEAIGQNVELLMGEPERPRGADSSGRVGLGPGSGAQR